MKKYCLIIVVVLLCNKVIAQQVTNLKGIVVDTDLKGNITPIQGAFVRWLNEKNIIISDSNGVFVIPFSNQTKKLIVSYVGYKTDTIFVAEKKFVKVLLITKNRLKDVNISIERKGSEISFIDPWKTTVMNEKELFKAACCNLSESFETNPSVDVNLTDAITGTKQIQMLGLASQYTQLTQEMIPGARGLAVNYGSAYTPGTWINSIQVTKGIGSVANGFESIAGQINTELHKSDVKETVYFNAYASEGGRYEANLNYAHASSPAFSQMILLHASALTNRMDNNNDGYLDNPLGYQLNAMYRFKFDKGKGLIVQGGVRTLIDNKTGGQFNYEEKADTINRLYGFKIKALRNDAFLKVGYVFHKKIYKSVGLQISGANQQYETYFGENTYKGTQNSFYSNLIYQSLISSSDHKFKTGLSVLYDNYDEQLFNITNYDFKRKEIVSGAFFEYTYSFLNKFTLVAGQRIDYNNLYGLFYTPRLHMRYALNNTLVLRASGGRGQRTANIISENTGLLVSARQFVFTPNYQTNAYGLQPEVAWNYGLSLTKNFKLNYKKGSWTIDYYYTNFENQIVVDRDKNAQQVRFYNLKGTSFSNSVQVQLDYELVKRLDVRMAYRLYNVQTYYDSVGLKEVPLIAAHRAFFNIGYTTKNKWNFDFTWQWIGEKRLPNTQTNPAENQLSSYSSAYTLLNTQISKSLFNKKLDMYVGVENILDFKQENPIIDAQNPFGSYFDASMVWGPVFGRMIYTGLRLKF
jgi:outer membrane receptor for ferrienterochelin and colicins